MTKRSANTKDRKFLQHRSFEVRFGYRVGSYFKGCAHCGDTIEVPWGQGMKRVWLSGYDVFRTYQPSRHGFMYWCYTCGAKDLEAWEPAESDVAYAKWLSSRISLPEWKDKQASGPSTITQTNRRR